MKPMEPMKPMQPMKPLASVKPWWPQELGEHAESTGGQNQVRYAFFAGKQRLALDLGAGNVEIYDTGHHQIYGVQQQQGGDGHSVIFTSQDGPLDLTRLRRM